MTTTMPRSRRSPHGSGGISCGRSSERGRSAGNHRDRSRWPGSRAQAVSVQPGRRTRREGRHRGAGPPARPGRRRGCEGWRPNSRRGGMGSLESSRPASFLSESAARADRPKTIRGFRPSYRSAETICTPDREGSGTSTRLSAHASSADATLRVRCSPTRCRCGARRSRCPGPDREDRRRASSCHRHRCHRRRRAWSFLVRRARTSRCRRALPRRATPLVRSERARFVDRSIRLRRRAEGRGSGRIPRATRSAIHHATPAMRPRTRSRRTRARLQRRSRGSFAPADGAGG